MNKDEAMLKIREQLKKLVSFSAETSNPEPSDAKFTSVKLKDGSEIVIPEGSDLAVGVEVYKVDADGNQAPLEDNTYELEDGRTITVVSGKVDSVADSGATGEETPVDDANTNMEASTPSGSVAATDSPAEEQAEGENPIEDRVTSLENQISQILELLQGMGAMQEVAMSKIEEIASQPAVESIKVDRQLSNNNFSSLKSEIEEMKEAAKKFNIGESGYNFTANRSK